MINDSGLADASSPCDLGEACIDERRTTIGRSAKPALTSSAAKARASQSCHEKDAHRTLQFDG